MWGWADLLQEAFARVLDGSRHRPDGLPMIVFLAGVMRSLKSEHWRRALRESRYGQTFRDDQSTEEAQDTEPRDPAPDPERSLNALQELAAIDRLFVDDPIALQIIAGLAEGLSAERIRGSLGISKIDYDSARRRMRRTLLREGLTCPTKMTLSWPETALTRVLEALEQELLQTSDEEIMTVAKELGMNPAMKGSAAFADIKYARALQRADIYGVETWRSAQTNAEKMAFAFRTRPKADSPKPRQLKGPRQRKG